MVFCAIAHMWRSEDNLGVWFSPAMRVVRFGNRCCCPLGLSYQTPDALLSRLLQVLLAASLWFPDPCISEFDWQKKLQFGFFKPREKRHSPERAGTYQFSKPGR